MFLTFKTNSLILWKTRSSEPCWSILNLLFYAIWIFRVVYLVIDIYYRIIIFFFSYTSVGCQVQSFFAAVKALSRKEMHYGAYATLEQVL